MADKKIRVVGVGSAMVDFGIEISDDDLLALGYEKSEGHSVSNEKVREILVKHGKKQDMHPVPGGSTANSLSTLAALSRGIQELEIVFVGCWGNDDNGVIYEASLNKLGIDFYPQELTLSTAVGLNLITPDKETTFVVAENASGFLPDDFFINIPNCDYFVCDGRYFSPKGIRQTARPENIVNLPLWKAREQLRDNGTKLVFSHTAMKARNIESARMIASASDIVFMNRVEAESLLGVGVSHGGARSLIDSDFVTKAIEFNGDRLMFITLGSQGSLVINNGFVTPVPAVSFGTSIVDTTGAGDAYLGAVLHCLILGSEPEEAALLATRIAATVTSSMRPRPELDYENVEGRIRVVTPMPRATGLHPY